MLEKLVGLGIMIIAIVALGFMSTLNLPTFIKIIFVLVGAVSYLVGVVIVFAEGSIFSEFRRVKKGDGS